MYVQITALKMCGVYGNTFLAFILWVFSHAFLGPWVVQSSQLCYEL